MEGTQELNNEELFNNNQSDTIEQTNTQEPFDPLSSNNQNITIDNQSHNMNVPNEPVNILLNRLITTRQQQDLDSQTDINGPINPFLRMIHRSIQLIPEQIIMNDITNILNESFNSEEKKLKPTKKEFIESLEVKVIEEEDSEKTCSICFDKLKVGEKYICLPCNDDHCFHIESCENCDGIKPWLNENNTCPVCRYELPLEEEETSDIQETGDIQEASDIQVDNRQIEQDIPEVTTNFDIELSQQDRERIIELITSRLNTLNAPPPTYSVNFMSDDIDEDGFSNMDIDEAIRQSLES